MKAKKNKIPLKSLKSLTLFTSQYFNFLCHFVVFLSTSPLRPRLLISLLKLSLNCRDVSILDIVDLYLYTHIDINKSCLLNSKSSESTHNLCIRHYVTSILVCDRNIMWGRFVLKRIYVNFVQL